MARMKTRFLVLAFAALAQLPAENPQLLILHKGGSSLGFYTREGKLLTTVPTGQHPHEMVQSPDGRLLYTTDNGTMRIEEAGAGGNSISIIDLKARRKIGEISLGEYHRPHGIDLDRATGRLAVSCELPDQVLIVDPAARKVVRHYETKGKTAHMVVFGPGAKYAYVSNSNSSDVSVINLATGAVRLIPTKARPEGSVLARDGRLLYVTNRNGRAVSIIDTTRQALAGEIPAGDGPVRIAITPDGSRLVWSLMNDKKVEIADVQTRKVVGQVPLPEQPVSLNLSLDGKLAYASAQDFDTVYVVSLAEKRIVRQIRTPKGSGPDPVLEIQ
jgi:YVTN family beta-propeller protein